MSGICMNSSRLMRPFIWTLTVLILFSALMIGHAEDKEIIVRTDWDIDHREVIDFSADAEEVKKVSAWHPRDGEMISLKSLVELATKRTKAPEGEVQYMPTPTLVRIEWTPGKTDFDWRSLPGIPWIATVHFVFSPDYVAHPGIKDGEAVVRVYLLPNGAPIHAASRPMTREEQLSFGLVTPTAKEAEEPQDKIGHDSFVPGMKSKE